MRKLFESFLIGIFTLIFLYQGDMSKLIYILLGLCIFYGFFLINKTWLKLVIFLLYLGLCLVFQDLIKTIGLAFYFLAYEFNLKGLGLVGIFIFLPRLDIFIISLLGAYLGLSTRSYEEDLTQKIKLRDGLKKDLDLLKEKSYLALKEEETRLGFALLEERNRISRDLHHTIGHLISSSILQLEALKIKNKDKTLEGDLNMVQSRLKEGIQDVRRSIYKLYEESIELEDELDKLRPRYPSLSISSHIHLSSDLGYNMKFDILEIIKESLNNSLKHSSSNEFSIYIREHKDFIIIKLGDKGQDQPKEIVKGIGLRSMEAIVDKYNGVLNYHRDKGFKIHISLMKE